MTMTYTIVTTPADRTVTIAGPASPFPEPSGPCQCCGVAPATCFWTGDDSTGLSLAHGCYQMWCEACCCAAQLRAAREAADRIPALEARLRELRP